MFGGDSRSLTVYSVIQCLTNDYEFILAGSAQDRSLSGQLSDGAFIAKVSILPNVWDEKNNSTRFNTSIIWSSVLPVVTYDAYFSKVIESSNNPGNYYAVGTIEKFAEQEYGDDELMSDYCIVIAKFDESGNAVITKVLGSTFWEQGKSLLEKSNGDIIILGDVHTFSENWYYEICVIRMSSDLESVIWTRLYGGDYDDWPHDMIELSTDGSIVIAGATEYDYDEDFDFFLLRVNSDNGNVIFAKAYGGSTVEVGLNIIETSDNHIVVSGRTDGFGVGSGRRYNVLVFKVDPETPETLVWSRAYGWENPGVGYSTLVYYSNRGLIQDSESSDLVLLNTRDEYGNDNWMSIVTLDPTTGAVKNSLLQGTSSSEVYGCDIIEVRDASKFYSNLPTSYVVVGQITDPHFPSPINSYTYSLASIEVIGSNLKICEGGENEPNGSVVSPEVADITTYGHDFDWYDFSFTLKMVTLSPTEYTTPGFSDVEMEMKSYCVRCNGYVREADDPRMCVHGICKNDWSCYCDNFRYTPPNCDVYDSRPYCGGIPAGEFGICDGAGTCVSEGQCECDSGYHNEDETGLGEDSIHCLKGLSSSEIVAVVLGSIGGAAVLLFVVLFCLICLVIFVGIPVLVIIVIIVLIILVGAGGGVAASNMRKGEVESKKNFQMSTVQRTTVQENRFDNDIIQNDGDGLDMNSADFVNYEQGIHDSSSMDVNPTFNVDGYTVE